jgi:hypothetical protein
VVVGPRFTARVDILTSLGLEAIEQEMAGQVIGSYIASDPSGTTQAPGVWAAGNVTTLTDVELRPSASSQSMLVDGRIIQPLYCVKEAGCIKIQWRYRATEMPGKPPTATNDDSGRGGHRLCSRRGSRPGAR